MTKTVYISVGASVASLAVGFFAGYLTAQKRLEKFYDERASREIGEANAYLRALYQKSNELSTEDEAEETSKEEEGEPSIHLEPAVEALTAYQGRGPAQKLFYHDIPPKDPIVAPSKTFGVPTMKIDDSGTPPLMEPDTDTGEDENALERARMAAEAAVAAEQNADPHNPYVVSDLTFFENDRDYPQASFTYYEGDRVLANEQDEVITDDDVIRMVGRENLKKFGHLSNDPEIVFIRNDQLQLDFEVSRSDGMYSKLVLDITDDGGGTG